MLHEHGSNNPNGVTSNGDRYAMHPYFIFKDLVTIFAFFLVLSVLVFFYPNLLGHSDNYIPADPMVTPASIYGISDNSLNNKRLLNSIDVGIVKIDGNKVYMTRQELKDYIINLSKNKIELLDTKTLNLFRSVANGIYQAEGHTGISFNNLNDLNFRPIWFISQNASKESIQFFILLKNILSQKGVNLNYSISVIDSGLWHIKLISRSLEDIVLKIFPYFNLVRAQKWNTFIYLENLFYIRNSLDYNREIVLLAYAISPKMNIPISEKLKILKLDTNSSILVDSLLKMKISREYSLAFLWGFFLGDGNFYIRVRLDQGFYFVPVFRISQIENSWNYQFLQDLKNIFK